MPAIDLKRLKSLIELPESALSEEFTTLEGLEFPAHLMKAFHELISLQISKGRFGRAFNGIAAWTRFASPLEEQSFAVLSMLVRYSIERGANRNFITFLGRLSTDDLTSCKPEWRAKFISILNYTNIWFQLAHEERAFLEHIKASKTPLVKSYLAHTEQLFLEHNMNLELQYKASGRAARNKEAFASTASLLVRRYGPKVRLSSSSFGLPICTTDTSEIVAAFNFLQGIEALIEFGIKIVHMNFDCIASGNGYLFRAANRITDMALSYGYVRNEFANLNFASKQTRPATRFREATNEYLKHWESTVKVVGEGISRRVRIETPVPLVKAICSELLLRDTVFGDERATLELVCAEFYSSPQEILAFEITPNLAIADVFKIIRIVRFFAYLRDPKVIELEADDPLAALNSMTILHTPKMQFIKYLLDFGIQLATAEDFLQLFSFNLADSSAGQMFDLQYQPMIYDESGLLLLPNVMAHSNLFRNVLVRSKKRFVGGDNKACLEAILETSLKQWTNKIKTDVPFRFRGIDGEIDLIFEFGNTIFVFECKDLLLPCNAFEQRSYVEQITKGTRQALRIVEFLKDEAFTESLSKKLGWNLNPNAKVQPAVITGGRLFSGASINGVAIRNLKEIINLIEAGKIYIGPSIDEFEEISLWSSDKLSSSDIEAYLAENSALYAPIWKNAAVEQIDLGFTSVVVTCERYGFDLLKSAEEMGVSGKTLNKMKKLAEDRANRYGK
jgi:hypothetical protein